MLTKLWNFLFVPKRWTIINQTEVCDSRGLVVRHVFILQDQYGNIKQKDIK